MPTENKRYNVGELEIDILGVSKSAEDSLAKTARGINSLYNAFKKFRELPTATIGLQLRDFLNDVDTALNSIDKNKLGNLLNLSKSMSSISNIAKIGKIDYSSVTKGFSQLLPALSPFLDRLDASKESLNALYGVLSKSTTKKLSILNGKGEEDKDKKGIFGIAKLGSVVYLTRRLAQITGSVLKMGSDYTETLNLWQVAMRKNLDTATKFVEKMNDAYSISKTTLMQAQATFRNMIGSLGDLSNEASYALSESITQMAIDYASLYNTTFDTAINKFQSALAGQVRPIRSISGYDITEKTIHAFYESIGGTKTMRQLSRTEKQLLSIYVIFNQMNASGALGDMSKTMDNFANQSRMLRENWEQIKAYSGVLLTNFIETNGIMIHINAFLIFMSTILESIAKKTGALNKNFVQDIFEDTTEAQKALDELNGSLLDFDKVRALNNKQENGVLSIDEKLLNALGTYNSQLQKADNSAQNLANKWFDILGVFDEDGNLTESANNFLTVLKSFGVVVGTIMGYKIIASAGKLIGKITGLKTSVGLLNTALSTGTIYFLFKAVEAFENGSYWASALYMAIAGGTGLIFAIRLLNKASATTLINMANFLNGIKGTFTAVSVLVGGIALFASSLDKLSSTAKVLIPVLSALAGVVAGLAVAKAGMSGTAIVTAGAIVTGISMIVGTLASIKQYANGGLPDKGSMFIAGESGAEIVYNMQSGQSGVANVQQIAQASYTGTKQALNDWWRGAKNDIPHFKEVSKTGIYEVAKSEMKRRGEW